MKNTPDILNQIAVARTRRVHRYGAAQGLKLPARRIFPRISFIHPPAAGQGILIAEIKRRSPSKGAIATIPEPAALAGIYADAGFSRVSVLTEEERFNGSLADLISVKKAHPHLALLRKDFLLTIEDIEVSHRAGADAVLLIAALLEKNMLKVMHQRAEELGIDCLVEVHSQEDIDKIRPIESPLVGINSRNLGNFNIEPLRPLEIRGLIDWPCQVVYESGIGRFVDVLFVKGTGFDGFLAGEALASNPDSAAAMHRSWLQEEEAERRYGAWKRLYARYKPGKTLIKMCGMADEKDALVASEAGADILGFVLAESPRQVGADFIGKCAGLSSLKAAVLTLRAGEQPPHAVVELLERGDLDFLQFHGDESPALVRSWPSYKALSLKTPEDAALIDSAGSPAVLVDAFSPTVRGGSGRRLNADLITAAALRRRLWLAGGLTPDNVAGAVQEFEPSLVDVSTGVADDSGNKRSKNHEKIRRFIAAVRVAEHGR